MISSCTGARNRTRWSYSGKSGNDFTRHHGSKAFNAAFFACLQPSGFAVTEMFFPSMVVGMQWALDNLFWVWMNSHRDPFLDHFYMTVTWAGSLAVLLPLWGTLLGWLIYRGKSGDAWLLAMGFGGAVFITRLVKPIIGRPRPNMFEPPIQMPSDFSFPSAHTAQITAFGLCLMIIAYRSHASALFWLVCMTAVSLIVVVGYSRLYLKVHHFSDAPMARFLFHFDRHRAGCHVRVV